MVSFRRHLSSLQSSGSGVGYGQVPLRPAVAYRAARPAVVSRQAHARAAMRRRRQNVIKALLVAVVVTGFIGFGMKQRTFMTANVIADVLLVGYVYLLVQIRKGEQTRGMNYEWSRAA